jgi:hypothetical protein
VSDDGPNGPPHQPRQGAQARGGRRPGDAGTGRPGDAGTGRPGDAGTRIYQGSVRIFSAVLLCIGLAIVVLTIAEGGGPLSVGVLMGVAFLGVGAARLWLAARMSR